MEKFYLFIKKIYLCVSYSKKNNFLEKLQYKRDLNITLAPCITLTSVGLLTKNHKKNNLYSKIFKTYNYICTSIRCKLHLLDCLLTPLSYNFTHIYILLNLFTYEKYRTHFGMYFF